MGVGADHPVLGHHGYLAGTAVKGATTIQFSVKIDIADDPKLWGGVFELYVANGTATVLALSPLTTDPFEADTFFDGVDFGALDTDGDGQVQLGVGMPAHNILMKRLMSHDHWSVQTRNGQE